MKRLKNTGIPLCLLALLVNPALAEDAVAAEVESVEVRGLGRISPSECTASTPCRGLRRGSNLHLTLTGKGYASVFLQDRWGGFYNQEGRQAVVRSWVGDVGLWPGVGTPGRDPQIDHSVFTLYIVVSSEPIPTSADDAPLTSLPDGTAVEVWGPVYLSVSSGEVPFLEGILKNKDWIFSGVGVAIVGAIVPWVYRHLRERKHGGRHTRP